MPCLEGNQTRDEALAPATTGWLIGIVVAPVCRRPERKAALGRLRSILSCAEIGNSGWKGDLEWGRSAGPSARRPVPRYRPDLKPSLTASRVGYLVGGLRPVFNRSNGTLCRWRTWSAALPAPSGAARGYATPGFVVKSAPRERPRRTLIVNSSASTCMLSCARAGNDEI